MHDVPQVGFHLADDTAFRPDGKKQHETNADDKEQNKYDEQFGLKTHYFQTFAVSKNSF
jgi:hypothetical protein